MKVLYNYDVLFSLLSNIHDLTGVWSNIHELNGHDIDIRKDKTAFCKEINRTEEGHARCVACDEKAASVCTQKKQPYHYRCHAGICENLIPIIVGGEVISFLGFGQLLDESSIEKQWRDTKKSLDWYKGNLKHLHELFLQMPVFSKKNTIALTNVLDMVAPYMISNGYIGQKDYSDIQRLELYIHRHYNEKITLDRMSYDLNIGKTKICSLSKKLSNGKNLTFLVEELRINDAKKLLATTDIPIIDVANLVGYDDYNYFIKVFKKNTGTTPLKFRKGVSED